MSQTREPVNPYRLVSLRERRVGLASINDLGRERSNPLVTQQQFADFLPIIGNTLPPSERSPVFDTLLSTDAQTLGRMTCGIASGITCLRSIEVDNDAPDMPNVGNGIEILAAIARSNGKPSINPENGEAFPQGWLAFSKMNEEVANWYIYHHALAYGIEVAGRGKVQVEGIRKFEMSDLVESLGNGIKFVLSVDNRMIHKSRFSGVSALNPGTHLVSVIGASESGEWVMVGDPYVESFSEMDKDPIPQWVSTHDFESHLANISGRFGIAIAPREVNIHESLADIGYPLARPM